MKSFSFNYLKSHATLRLPLEYNLSWERLTTPAPISTTDE